MTNGTILIGGPTASGKSKLALDLAEALEESGGATIINADSMQVYSDLRIVTDRPSADDESRVPHALYGVLAGDDVCSAGRWRRMAVDAMGAAHEQGRTAIVVGGTGLYLRALTQGLSDIPDIPDAIRRDARAAMEDKGPEQFHRELAGADPKAATAIPVGDTQRSIRAWEVWQATGRSLVDWQSDPPEDAEIPGQVAKIVVMPDRPDVYARAEARVAQMVDGGVLDEIRALEALKLPADLPAMRAVGVPEFLGVVRGDRSLSDAIVQVAQASRRFAKRQYTWFRHQTPDWQVFAPGLAGGEGSTIAQQSERFFDEVFPYVRQNLLTKKS
ncbi:MAG: tRNA (adenosine(37)-N6)-dimethylallyltransferase MiaA [Alphaproteobacteria bacterium]|jgi:tRNA dimethylallyltransferase|nr:tRNA (adenosine(37)-N6)-dimethylallyltransferase MiaA [Alphaproteobacteria bacterium]MBT5860257.1 tRNA (adenosine(37)-N6)-dimethylallyltransferase MiaA [Alphaproteobacteria bacterium]